MVAKNKRSKKIYLYFVEDRNNLYLDENNTVLNILCVTTNKKEALEFINKKIYEDNYNHFTMWCNLRNMPVSPNAWKMYFMTAIGSNNPYMYVKVKVDYSMIASVFRIFYGCKPIGCSFDTLIEKLTLEQSVFEEKVSEVC